MLKGENLSEPWRRGVAVQGDDAAGNEQRIERAQAGERRPLEIEVEKEKAEARAPIAAKRGTVSRMSPAITWQRSIRGIRLSRLARRTM
jgi:hypothetical protein